MTDRPKSFSGSRFLYDAFDCRATNCAPSHKIEANERVAQERWDALEYRLNAMNALLARLEKRLWLTIVGVASAVLADAVQSILSTQ
ncbi:MULTISPECIES: GTA head formation protein, RCAP_rcc01685 family [unclassified Dinoroseobacter]|uniref:GTA head formation protein, RCAP_rcc01685 family n=1 Tax=unclassified Dinoroseobacter TaxID=2620028 RepID=UPI003C7A6819